MTESLKSKCCNATVHYKTIAKKSKTGTAYILSIKCSKCKNELETDALFTHEQLLDCARFSNFAQSVKMKYWEKHPEPYVKMADSVMTDLLLIAYKELKK